MAKAEKGNELVEVKGGAVAPAFMEEFLGTTEGFENADKDSYAIPLIYILQKMSPICDEDDPSYVGGAKAGMLYNTVTGELYDGKEGVEIIPCYFRRSFIHWGPREGDGGGFKGEFSVEEVDQMRADGTIQEFEGKLLKPLPDGKLDVKKCEQFVDTRSHFILIKGKNGFSQALLPLSSTQLKASKNLMMALSQKRVDLPDGSRRTVPTFANVVKATTIGQSNDKGAWSGIKFELIGLVTNQADFADAKAFKDNVASGEIKADFGKADPTHGAGSETQADGF